MVASHLATTNAAVRREFLMADIIPRFRLGFICAALAAGEALGAAGGHFAEAWPAVAIAAGLVALFGYGFAVRAWSVLAVALLGLSLALGAQTERERFFRQNPWMREARQIRRIPARTASPAVAAIRRDLARRIGLGLAHDPATADLARAILLGERTRLPRALKRDFITAGTIHVFAVSGLHVGVVAFVLIVLGRIVFIPARFAEPLAIPVLWAYVILIGCPPSAVRAAAMATIYFAAPLFRRRHDGLRAWKIAFLAVHLLHPAQIANVGSALSFAVMLAILLAVRCIRGRLRGWRAALCVSAAAWAGGVPVAAHVFGRLTPGGLLANLAAIPAASASVVAGILGVGASFVSETLAAHLNNLAALLIRTMVGVSRAVAALPGANFEIRKWNALECALWYAAFVAVLWLLRPGRRRIV